MIQHPHQRSKPAQRLHFSPSTTINPSDIYSFTWKLIGVLKWVCEVGTRSTANSAGGRKMLLFSPRCADPHGWADSLVRALNRDIFLPCFLWPPWVPAKTPELEAHHLASIFQKCFESSPWSTSSQCSQNFVELQQQQFNTYLGFSQCLLSSLEMVLIIWAQEPIMADMILTTSCPRMTMNLLCFHHTCQMGPWGSGQTSGLWNHPWCE